MKIAACLIVKDSAATIEACLNSIRPFVDEINVYDTGSTDDTLEVLAGLAEFRSVKHGEDGQPVYLTEPPVEGTMPVMVPIEVEGATFGIAPIRVEQGEWRDDFSWARQQSFDMASDDVEWFFWLDDDDIILGAHNLRRLAQSAPPELDGFVFHYTYARDERGNCICELWRERLMRRSAAYTWKGPVHEVLIPPDGKVAALANIPKEQVDYIHARPADRYSPDRNLKILLAEKDRIEAEGGTIDPRTLAYLGTEQMAKGQFAAAVIHLQDYLNRKDAGWSDERMQVAHKLATCLRMMGNPLAAVEVEWQAMLERDDWAETAVGLCESFTMLGRWDRVETWAKRALDLGMPQSMLILNPLEFTFVPLVRLAEACAATDRFDEAIAWLEHAQRISPEHPLLLERRGQYDQAHYDHQLLTSFLTVREGLIRHDENWKAYELMKAVPYRIADHPMIVKARADSRENVLHALQPEEYIRWYSEEPKESTMTDDLIDLVGEGFGRVGGLLKGLQAQEEELGRKPLLLDLGCNDWWMGEFFARQGYRCDGIELNRRSYEKALDRRDRFEREATIVHGDLHHAADLLDVVGHRVTTNGNTTTFTDGTRPKYDAVSLFEVIEHVPDIQKTLDVCESLIRPGGRVYVSTPDGAFENGNIAGWSKVERKGHLRAMPIHELAEVLNARGEVLQLEHTNGDNIAFASYTPQPKKGKVIFYAGGSFEPWSPASIHTTGLGGSETALVQVSTRLAMDGYEVKVYAAAEPGLYEALWRPHTAWDPTEECDLLVISRLPHALDNPIAAKHTALWCHDHSYPGILTEERAENVDSVIVLSEWERERYARLYPFLEDKLVVIRNGITVHDIISGETRFPDAERTFEERKPRCLFTSSADRGLDVMLEVWPDIREQVPAAELHVFYGFDVFDRVAITNPMLFAYKAGILNKVNELGGEDAGIFLRGRVGQRDLYDEMQQARVWSYPTAFLETSCIGAMEARACGLPIVTSDLGALQESAGSHGQLIPWASDEDEPQNRTPEYKTWFVREVTRLLTDERRWKAWHRRALAGVDELDWSERMPEWLALMAAEVREAVAA
jgi:glycosyltransferase involved in cell wall biosynthesis